MNPSRQACGRRPGRSGAKTGAAARTTRRTRRAVGRSASSLLPQPLCVRTPAQITVPQPGEHQAEDLAALAAALCHQSLAWDARIRDPVPLHFAGAVDRNRPEYRGPSFDAETERPSEDPS
ncbi:RNaseH domain-containing protein [Streptomyces sp. NPDC056144]|uniref:RNaseH domain-containing protein n=1 Tax=unclassified Streptomyces TaxID=2593676 RepID=UPI0035DB7A58